MRTYFTREGVFMNYIGIDLGGTNIKGALVSAKGEIL